jgi:hypothetical protein
MGAHAGPDIVTDGLELHLDAASIQSYPGSGSTWTDLVNGNSGTLYNETFNSANGGGFVFNGTTTYCSIDVSGLGLTTDVGTTVCAFVYRTSTATTQKNCISYRTGDSFGDLYIGSASNKIFSYYSELDSPGFTDGSFPKDEFAYITVRLNDDGSITHMTNGANKATSAVRTGFSSGVGSTIKLSSDLEYFEGTMFSFQHYSRELTDDEIIHNYNATRGRFGL